MTNLGVMIVGGTNKKRNRQPDDFYPTPSDCTLAFLRAEKKYLNAIGNDLVIWEPACGDGAMAQVIEAEGYSVLATDLRDRGYGNAGRDFLKERWGPSVIITNPPFNLASRFIEHALSPAKNGGIGATYLGLLLKSNFWHAQSRVGLFTRWPPARIYALTWRPDFMGLGAPTLETSWFVWHIGYEREKPLFDLLRRPNPSQGEALL